jgi:sporadic carbohydrate cluster 2OG-Fe(II) oxygenase
MKNLIKSFKEKGYFIANLNNKEIKKINLIKINIKKNLKIKINKTYLNKKNFFENFHKFVSNQDINSLRLSLYKNLNKNNFNFEYYDICSRFIEPLVGIENVIQKKINLSIQLPNDNTSLLPVHADTWAGDSPYEVVAWLPLVNSKRTQSMFILPKNSKKYVNFSKKIFKTNEEIMKYIKNDIKFLNIRFGQILIFSQNLPHGNIINKEKTTRWSFNARIKNLMSPYSTKGLLDFFDVIKLMPATEIGLNYEYPKFK